ncbi:MAG: hypothetical protein HZC42_04465 [Candidatus Eisenbacteria bacterium]|nr:hypothetical protein [Candidatus Eisenbacteria bacterium]
MRTMRLAWAAVLLMLAGAAAAGTLSDADFVLYYLAPGGDVPVLSTSQLPTGSNVPPNNRWRYDYRALNKSANPLNTWTVYFNSDNVDNAHYVSGSAPANWVITKLGPVAPNFNYKIRFRTTVAGAKIPANGVLACSVTFDWTGPTVPGVQNYDAINDGGSESGVTTELTATPAQTTTWGRIKALYR